MTSKDSLGDRMKKHEYRTRTFIPMRTYTIIRLDGRSFHTFTRGCTKPFDRDLMDCMQLTALKLCESIQNCKLGYTQSDEITLILTDFENRETEAWFGGNLQKMVSVSSAIATAEFNKQWMLKKIRDLIAKDLRHAEDVSDLVRELPSAHFDSRAYTVSEGWEAFNSVLWRQNDASKNSVQMVARALYPHAELQEVGIPALHEMIYLKGQNWNNYPTDCKRGAFIVKDETGWVVDKEGPILTQDKEYFFSKVPQYDQYIMGPTEIEE